MKGEEDKRKRRKLGKREEQPKLSRIHRFNKLL